MVLSFKDYFNYRKNMSISEMAADPIEFTDKKGNKYKQEEIRKAPILFDQDDIDYLYQFPPMYWTQALTLRYGDFLRMAWEKISKGSPAPDVMDVKIKGHGRDNELIFPKIKVNLNQLYEKLTEDVDDASYAELDPSKKQEFLSKSDRGGTYGFVLSNYKKSKGIGVSEGYVELSKKDIQKRLNLYLRAIADGWFTRTPKDQERIDPNSRKEVVEFGGSNRKTLPVSGKQFWFAFRARDKKRIRIGPQNVPILKPAVMISSEAYRRFQKKKNYVKRINEDFRGKKTKTYFDLLDPQKSKLVTDRISVLEELIKEERFAQSTQQRKKVLEARAELKRLKEIQNIIKNTKEFVFKLLEPETANLLKKQFSNLKSFLVKNPNDPNVDFYRRQMENTKGRFVLLKKLKDKKVTKENYEQKLLDRSVFNDVISQIHNNLRISSYGIQIHSKRYDIHDWNMHQLNPNLPKFHTSMTGLGTINPTWQQPESVHGSLKKYEIDHEEFWKELSEFLVSIQNLEEDAINPRVKKIGSSNEFEDVGSLASGINEFLKRPEVYRNRAVYYAMVKNFWQIFDNASRRFQKLIGSRHFMRFLPKYKEFSKKIKSNNPKVVRSAWEDKELKQAFEEMKDGAKRAGRNYAQMVFQLKKRLSQSATNLSNIIVFSQSKSDNLFNSLKNKPLWNRLLRPEDPQFSSHGEQGRTSHSIELLKTIVNSQEINRTIENETNSKLNNSFSSDLDEMKMIENIVQTGMAFVIFRGIYISLMGQLKNKNLSESDLEQADEFASKILDNWMRRKGIRNYRGSLSPSQKALGAVAQDRSKELEEIKKQLVDFGHTQEEIQSILNQLQQNPQSIELKVRKLIKILKSPKEIFKLSKNNPNARKDLRLKIEEKINKKDFGHEIMLKILQSADNMTEAPK